MAAVTEEAKQRARERNKAWREANRDKVREINARNNKARTAKYRAANRETCLRSQRDYYERNREDILAYLKEYRDTTDKHKESNEKWYQANKHIKRASTAKRRAQLRQATVNWADVAKIKAIYAEADRLTHETEIEHVVDHIIPLSSKVVCGLHWEGNLRVITNEENGHKGNKLLPEFSR